MPRTAVLVLAALLVVLLMGGTAVADVCPACHGTGRVGCGGCHWPFVGKCGHCSGMYATTTPNKCPRCHGSQTCQGCSGKGMNCLGCNGTGRLPDGTLAAGEAMSREKAKAAVQQALKPFSFLAGSTWSLRGREGDKGFSGSVAVGLCFDGTWLRQEERTVYDDGRLSEGIVFLTYEPARKGYFALVFAQPGRCVVLRGAASADGKQLDLVPQGQDNLHLVWRLKPGEGLDTTLEEGGEAGTSVLVSSELRKAGSTAVREDVEPGYADEGDQETAKTIQEALEPLARLAGKWAVRGREGTVAYTGTTVASLAYDGTYLRLLDAVKYSDGRTWDAEAFLSYEPGTRAYLMVVLSEPGRSQVLRGTMEDGVLALGVLEKEDAFRLVWRMRDDGFDSTFEGRSEEGGWAPISSSELRRPSTAPDEK